MRRRGLCALVLFGLLVNTPPRAQACGPSYLEPIFVFADSPDLPFEDFVAGRIGIVQPTFGRKTLLISYRYLNGGSFSANEQKDLVLALKSVTPEQPIEEVVELWLAARKQYLHKEKPPSIYTERNLPFSGYNFFPNCTQNAFEVATATLKDRVASYGADDRHVREWVRGQDEVFQNCAAGTATIPQQLRAGVPVWLQKDRDYQIAAALFYSMQFDEARARFEKIAGDGESDWKSTADYLVARTLVRQASLTEDQQKQTAAYQQAERRLQTLVASGNQFRDASRKLLGLIRYRTRPEERAGELAELVSHNGASMDLRQDVIDYVWLLDKFESQVMKAEHERREALKKKEAERETTRDQSRLVDPMAANETIGIVFAPRFADGSYDHQNLIRLEIKNDTPEAEVLRLAEQRLNRSLTAEESKDVTSQFKFALDRSKWFASYNRKLTLVSQDHESCYYCEDIELKLADLPDFLSANDLTDWIFTLQMEGPETNARALAKWRQTESPAWLAAALIKADATSSGLADLIRAAEQTGPDTAAFPTIVFHLARLKVTLGKVSEARQLLDAVLNTHLDLLPVSAQNQFRVERAQLAKNLVEFLRYSALKPAAFYEEGLFVSIRDLVESRKEWWSSESYEETKEVFEARIEKSYQNLLSDDLRLFDDSTNNIMDRHLSLRLLQQTAKDSQVPASLRSRLTLNVWTRAILLDHHEVALQVTPAVIEIAPEMKDVLAEYLQAKTDTDRRRAALYVLLKSPDLTPFLAEAPMQFRIFPTEDYYFESAWWCSPSETEYREGKEVPKVVAAPDFLDTNDREIAKREYAALSEIGDAKTFLGKHVLQWAAEAPEDPRIPEALFIVFKANESHKYGCNGWETNVDMQQQSEEILRERYPKSQWTAKLPPLEDR